MLGVAVGRESNRCGTAGESDVGSDDDRSRVEREHRFGGGDKPATLETGLTVTVPLFVNIGDRVVVNTANGGEYKERAK